MTLSNRSTWIVLLALVCSGLVSGSDAYAADEALGQPYACEENLLEIMFAWDSRVRMREGNPIDLATNALDGVEQALSRVAWHEWQRICDVPEETLNDIQARGEANTGQPVYNLNNIYRLRIPQGHDVWALGQELEALPGVLLARPVPLPMAPPTPPDYLSWQGYLRPASWTPTGIDADYAWTQAGGDGSGVTVCDLEYSWNYNHDDVTKALGSQINSNVVDPFGNNDHGTAVIGEMVSDNNGWGTTGISHAANLLTCGTYYGSPPSWNVPGAIAVAIANLQAGDVCVLEQQWERTPGMQDYVPIEWWMDYTPHPQSYNAVYAAIANGVAIGISFVEAGGNGGVDTDLLTWTGDSGAIIVGAGGVPPGTPGDVWPGGDLERLSFSSYGSRFNLQGWGEAVVTTGYGDLYAAEGVDRYYTLLFSGTSSATPIVAGAAASCIGYWYANVSSTPPSPAYIRNLLVSTGTPQIFGPAGAIGPRPDLGQALPAMQPQQEEGEYGDAPEGAIAYPSSGVIGAFPTCMNSGPASWVFHGPLGWARFELNPAPGVDFEMEGNAGNCPNFPPYDADECFNDGDAGLMFPPAYTIQGGVVVPCSGQTGDLGLTCQTATWGVDVDIFVVNHMPVDGYVNVLVDWDQDGQWAGSSQCPGGAAPEHVLVNFLVPMGYMGPLSGLMPPNFLIGPNDGYAWSRFTISETPVPQDWDGAQIFEDGETEDYLLSMDEDEPGDEGEYGDAPEGAMAYPSLGVMGAFPTCVSCGPAGWVYHGPLGWARFELNPAPGVDFEMEGNAGNCPNFPPYDADECFNDGDAGLMFPPAYTIQGGVVVPCSGQTGDLGLTCQTATWGVDIDIWVVNQMPVDGYVNVLADWDQDGQWAGASQCPGGAAPEHVLVNFLVPMGYMGPLSALAPPPFLIGPNHGYAWARFTVSEHPVPQDWNGEEWFEDGETEDYLLRVDGDPLGACCIHEAQCILLTAGDCAAAGGNFQGAGSDCDPNPCPYDEARVCCDGQDCHLVSSELDCSNLSGQFHPHWLSCNANPCQLRDWADHDVGNCTGTVTDQGILGFIDGAQSEGSGFIYPYGGSNLLFVGGLWVGESDSYIANRDYDDDPDREWMVSVDPDGHVWVDVNGESDQDIHTIYTDSAAVSPRGLFVQQESWAFSRDNNEVMDDFIILRYFIENRGSQTIDDAYIGVFLDVDIDSMIDNVGAVEAARNLVYITDHDTSTVHVGLRLLQDASEEPAVANLSLIHNPTYVWPQSYILDDDKYGFLSAGGAEYTVTDTSGLGEDDYSMLASAGPFTLEPDEQQLVVFAIVGGQSLEHLRQNADVAQLVHEKGRADVPAGSDSSPRTARLMWNTPNPFAQSTVIRFELAQAGEVDLSVHDVSGRRVRLLTCGSVAAGMRALSWDGRDDGGRAVSSGIYFLRLKTATERVSRRIVVTR